jgi:KTSC domain
MRSVRRLICLALGLVVVTLPARAESVNVKYRGDVNLAPFDCTDIIRSSFVRRICYDSVHSYMLIILDGTYYHYCEIDDETVTGLLHAESVGSFLTRASKAVSIVERIAFRAIEIQASPAVTLLRDAGSAFPRLPLSGHIAEMANI